MQIDLPGDRAAPLVLGFSGVADRHFFYPISATFVLVPAAHLLLNENTSRIRTDGAAYCRVRWCGFVALFVVHKFIVLPHLSDVPYLGDYAFRFEHS